ncbi:hypothetical protein [Nostoc sp.]|uniref:hypothetical protein n=1 Tax=Nostoc sp. TaxID=1180 RepID=UPI002FFAB9B0
MLFSDSDESQSLNLQLFSAHNNAQAESSANIGFTEERQRAGGRRQEAGGRRQEEENIFFALCQTGLKPLNLFMNKGKKCILRRAAQKNTASIINPLNLFMGITSCLLPL